MESIKVSIYYFNTADEEFKLYPFAGEEFVLKFSVTGTKDKMEAQKSQDEGDKRIDLEIEDKPEKGYKPTFATRLINFYRSAQDKNDLKESEEPVGSLLPKREFMGRPYFQIAIPIAIIIFIITLLLIKK